MRDTDRKFEAFSEVAAHPDGRLYGKRRAARRVAAALAPAVAVGRDEIDSIGAHARGCASRMPRKPRRNYRLKDMEGQNTDAEAALA